MIRKNKSEHYCILLKNLTYITYFTDKQVDKEIN